MGQLTNLYVSQSYQGLLKMTDSTNGLTNTLQTVQTGDGDNSPLQMSLTEVNISGSFLINNVPITNGTSGTSGTSGVAGSSGSSGTSGVSGTSGTSGSSGSSGTNGATGSSGTAGTSGTSGSSGTSGVNGSSGTSGQSGSNGTSGTSGVSGSSGTSGDSIFAQTGSYWNTTRNVGITGSLNVTGTVTATSASFTYVNTVYETASVIYSSGSNQLGDANDDTQTLWGTVALPDGTLNITNGSVNVYNQYGGVNILQNPQGSGSQYPGFGLNTDSTTYGANGVFAGFSIADVLPNSDGYTYLNNGTYALSSYQSPYGDSYPEAVLVLAGGGQYLGDDTSIGFRSGSIDVWKPTRFKRGNVEITGSLTVNGSQITPSNRNGLITTGSFGNQQTISGSLKIAANSSSNPALYLTGAMYLSGTLNNMNFSRGPVDEGASVAIGFNTLTKAVSGSNNTAIGASVLSNTVSGSYNLGIGSTALLNNVGNNNMAIGAGAMIQNTVGENNTALGGSSLAQNRIGNHNLAIGRDTMYNNQSGSYNTAIGGQALYNNISGSSNVAIGYNAGLNETGDNNFYLGNRNISGVDAERSGSLMWGKFNPTTANQTLQINAATDIKNNTRITGSATVRSGNLSTISNNTTLNIDSYLTSSDAGQSNQIKGWGDNPAAGGAGAVQANYSGSLTITGSNNIVSMPQIRATGIGGGADQQGYISGSDNIIASNGSGIYLNTGSLLYPKTSNNIIGNSSLISMNFTTSSLAGGHPSVVNNLVFGGSISLNSNSGSITTVGQNFILGGQIASTQNFVTNTRPTITGNNVIGNVALNHISSSINYQSNYNNAPITINNFSSSSFALSSTNVTNNTFLGGDTATGPTIFISGSMNTSQTRTIASNLLGGRNLIVSSSAAGTTNNQHLLSTIAYGQALYVSASHSGTQGGSAFFGRYNDTGSLSSAQDNIFVVGTGTGTNARRNGLWIDSSSNTTISGSLNVTGSVGVLLPTNTNNFTINAVANSNIKIVKSGGGGGTPFLNVQADSAFTGSLNVNGNTTLTGSVNITGSLGIANAGDLTMYGHTMFNVGTFYDTTTQSGSANVSQSISYNTTDITKGVSVVSGTRLTVANAGTYNIQFSAQIDRVAGSGTDTVYIWLKKNGSNVVGSAGAITISGGAAAAKTISSWNYVVDSAANDYYELVWQPTDTNIQLIAAAASGNIPSIPSIITTVTQVR